VRHRRARSGERGGQARREEPGRGRRRGWHFAGIRYRHTASGRVEIESKEDAKKRGQQSPDRAEALVLAFARAVPRQQTVAFSVPVRISPI
jgi:hypothetical protein